MSLNRVFTVGILAASVSFPAVAADYLRGPYAGNQQTQANTIDWAGTYVAGQIGFSSNATNFSTLSAGVAQRTLPNLAITDQLADMVNFPDHNRAQGKTFGAIAGMNFLWDDVVLGVEADYTRSSFSAVGNSDMRRSMSAASTGSDVWDVRIRASVTSRVTDYGSMRARIGWAAGNFMPFVTAGVALGNVNTSGTSTGWADQYAVTADPVTGLAVYTLRGSTTNTYNFKQRGVAYGGAMGAGVDMAFFSNMFVRAEWQYITFASSGIRPELGINTARVAGGVKF